MERDTVLEVTFDYEEFEFIERDVTLEVAFVMTGNDKFAYYKDAKTDTRTGQIPVEY